MKSRIRELRKQKRYSQIELANVLHVTQTSVSQWETGKTNPDHQTLVKIADLFGVTTDYILGRTDFPFDNSKPLIDANTGKEIKVERGPDGLFHPMDENEQKKEAPTNTAKAIKEYVENKLGREATPEELSLVRAATEALIEGLKKQGEK